MCHTSAIKMLKNRLKHREVCGLVAPLKIRYYFCIVYNILYEMHTTTSFILKANCRPNPYNYENNVHTKGRKKKTITTGRNGRINTKKNGEKHNYFSFYYKD